MKPTIQKRIIEKLPKREYNTHKFNNLAESTYIDNFEDKKLGDMTEEIIKSTYINEITEIPAQKVRKNVSHF